MPELRADVGRPGRGPPGGREGNRQICICIYIYIYIYI